MICPTPTNQAGNCVQQDECIDVDIQKTVISSGWEVCFDDITLKDSWASGSYGKLCKTVEGGASATFGIADGCGCKSNGDALSTVFITSERTAAIATCSYTGGHCNNGNANDCTWTIDTPNCAPPPTPEPTVPTLEPTVPTSTPTDDKEPCDCYRSAIIDDSPSNWDILEYGDQTQSLLKSSFYN